jgi:hypothetical protein
MSGWQWCLVPASFVLSGSAAEKEGNMSRALLALVIASAVVLDACGGSRNRAVVSTSNERLANSTVTFTTLSDGKDAKSAVTVQLLRNGNELAAEAMSSGTEFDDRSTSAPIVMSIRSPFVREDGNSAQLRLRLAPDGDDTWTFNVGLTLRYANETQQNFAWSAIRLDEKAPERTLVLAGAQVP